MTLIDTKLRYYLNNKKVVKVITGLSNVNVSDVVKTVKAAEIAKATYVDVASNPKLVKILKSLTTLPICVSSIEPQDLYECSLAGADVFEIGNFDAFYNKNLFITAPQVLKLVKEVKLLLGNKPICVTIPHTLLLSEQVDLARKIQKMGVTMIQTEGYTSKSSRLLNSHSVIARSAYCASLALSSSYTLFRDLNTPIIASSGLNHISTPLALLCGASGIGIGSALTYCQSISSKAEFISQIVSTLNKHQTLSFPYLQVGQTSGVPYI